MPKNTVLEKFSLAGKTALVTGGGGLYGQAIVDALAEAGATVWIASRDLAKLKSVAAQKNKLGLDVRAAALDQGRLKSADILFTRIVGKSGRLDVLVNNAVVWPMKSYSEPTENFAKSMAVNCTGLFHLTRLFGDAMARQKSGSIINIGSIQGMVGPDATLYEGLPMNGLLPDYFFHKGGMLNYSRFLAAYYGPSNVRCNCLSPGGVLSERMTKAFIKRYSKRTFLERPASLDDIKGAAVFLASDASLYITGSNLVVDGGYTAK